MFNETVNVPKSVNMAERTLSESDLIDRAVAKLKASLPASWPVNRLQEDSSEPSRADAILQIGSSNQGVARVIVEARKSFTPKDVDAAVGRARLLRRVAGEVPFLVVAPWLSERSRALLEQAGLNYLDLAGNVMNSRNTRKSPLGTFQGYWRCLIARQ